MSLEFKTDFILAMGNVAPRRVFRPQNTLWAIANLRCGMAKRAIINSVLISSKHRLILESYNPD
jgi:hypothetical protein